MGLIVQTDEPKVCLSIVVSNSVDVINLVSIRYFAVKPHPYNTVDLQRAIIDLAKSVSLFVGPPRNCSRFEVAAIDLVKEEACIWIVVK